MEDKLGAQDLLQLRTVLRLPKVWRRLAWPGLRLQGQELGCRVKIFTPLVLPDVCG